MRTTTGRSCDERAFVLLAWVLLLTAGTLMGGVFLSHQGHRLARDRWLREEATLAVVKEGFLRSVQSRLSVPGEASWAAAISEVTALNPSAIEWVDPAHPSDPSNRRLLLLDPSLPSGCLPYVQGPKGVGEHEASLLTPRARVMVVSTTRRGTPLPIANRQLDQATFDALWDWTPDPVHPSSPRGWPEDWVSHGHTIHIARIPLASLFARIHLNGVRYGVRPGPVSAGTVEAEHWVESPLTIVLLKGSLLTIWQTNGVPHQARLIRGDATFDLAPESASLLTKKDGP